VEENTGPGEGGKQRRQYGAGGITDLGDGKYRLRFYKDEDGQRKQKNIIVRCKSKQEARRELTRLQRDVDTGCFITPKRLTVGEFLDRWLADYAEPKVSPKTYERYEEIVRVHLKPALGACQLQQLSAADIQRFYRQAREGGRKQGAGGLSPQTIIHFHRLLREALGWAVKWQLILRNPTDAVVPESVERQEPRALDPCQVKTLLAAAKDTSMHVPIVLALSTGLRRGELVGLRWEDLDLDAGILMVRRSMEVTKGSVRAKAPKTKSGRRRVDLPPVAVEALIKHKARQAERRLLLGPDYHDEGIILAGRTRERMHPDSLTTMFDRIATKAGLEGVHLHDLRHTHATLLLLDGVHAKIVSERLGHANIGITLDTYSHVLPGMQGEAARKIDAALRDVV
jgi:integrase